MKKFKNNILLLVTSFLCILLSNAQTIQRSNIPAPKFEVTGSIYPWEVI